MIDFLFSQQLAWVRFSPPAFFILSRFINTSRSQITGAKKNWNRANWFLNQYGPYSNYGRQKKLKQGKLVSKSIRAVVKLRAPEKLGCRCKLVVDFLFSQQLAWVRFSPPAFFILSRFINTGRTQNTDAGKPCTLVRKQR